MDLMALELFFIGLLGLASLAIAFVSVSYTHLTLPTILLV